jgi:hypothetical protein
MTISKVLVGSLTDKAVFVTGFACSVLFYTDGYAAACQNAFDQGSECSQCRTKQNMRVWYRRCALAFQAREDRRDTGYPLQQHGTA